MLKTKVLKIRGNKIGRDALEACAEALRAGGTVVFPTDTVYGLACNAFNPKSIQSIYALKGRSYTKPLPLLISSVAQLSLVADGVIPEAHVLTKHYWPGPLTLVFKTGAMVINAARGKSTIAVRVPDHPVTQAILEAAHVPLATTSANKSGKGSLTTGKDVVALFKGLVDVIIDGGTCPGGRESTVVNVAYFPFTVVREGAVSRFELTQRLNLG